METLKLIVEYDGTHYAGWQRQPDCPTVQAVIEEAFTRITQTRTTVIAAGRTDAGVHALGQVVSVQVSKILSADAWRRALNAVLPPDIAVQHVERVPQTFHARYHATSKVYEYKIHNAPARPALQRRRVWHIPHCLDIPAMERAAAMFVGTRDFSSFQGSPTSNRNPWCTVTRCDVTWACPHLSVTCEADRFLKQMVRAMVGTLIEVGEGKRRPEDIPRILEAKDRRAAGRTAPPHGLYLVSVTYQSHAAPRRP